MPVASMTDHASDTADPSRYEARPETESALIELEAVIARGAQIVLLSGPAGAGKTLILRVLGERMRHAHRLVFSPFLHFVPEEADAWLRELLLAAAPDEAEAGDWQAIARRASATRPLVLMVDEAQSIPPDTAAHLVDGIRGVGHGLCGILAGIDGPQLDRVVMALGDRVTRVHLSEPPQSEEALDLYGGATSEGDAGATQRGEIVAEVAEAPTVTPEPEPEPEPEREPDPDPDPETAARPVSVVSHEPRVEDPAVAATHSQSRESKGRGTADSRRGTPVPRTRSGGSRKFLRVAEVLIIALAFGFGIFVPDLVLHGDRADDFGPLPQVPQATPTPVAVPSPVVVRAPVVAPSPIDASAPVVASPPQSVPLPSSATGVDTTASEEGARLDGEVSGSMTRQDSAPNIAAVAVTLHVNARPWASIRLDGEELGATPLSRPDTSSGRYEIEATFPDGRVTKRIVEVGPDTRFVGFP